jgi:hypothetical protein
MLPEIGERAEYCNILIRSLPMSCATITKRKRRRKYEDGEGRPYSELSPEAKERAREWWRERERNDFNTDGMTEMLVNDLEYEYGIEVSYSTCKCGNGKTYNRPDIEWDFSYCQGDGVSFKTDINLEKMAAHGVPGCEYFSFDAQKLAELWKGMQVVEAVSFSEYSIDWTIRLDKGNATVEYRTYRDQDEGEDRLCTMLATEMEKILESIYKDACRRLEKIGYDDIEYRNSDECIEEEIEANDYKFDEAGERV